MHEFVKQTSKQTDTETIAISENVSLIVSLIVSPKMFRKTIPAREYTVFRKNTHSHFLSYLHE